MAAQVIKRYTRRRVVGILHRVVRGTQEAAVEARHRFTQEGEEAALINSAYIERFQAAFRSQLARKSAQNTGGDGSNELCLKLLSPPITAVT